MKVLSLSLENFRNFEREEISFSEGTNVITGQNAQGKTNLLEAVYLLCLGRSFRTRFDRELINFGSDFAAVAARIEAQERQQRIEISLRRGQRKRILQNGVKKTAGELQSALKTVLFCPDDLSIIKSGAAERRRLLDTAI